MKRRIIITGILLIFISCKKKDSNAAVVNIHHKNKVINTPKAIDKDFILGKFMYQNDPAFVKVDSIHSSKIIYINKLVYSSFIKMYNAAKKEGIDLKIISGTRNFNEQKVIWEKKWLKYDSFPVQKRIQKILEYSAMPSTSRHHWGTDIDINSLSNSYFSEGTGKKEYDWLSKNANTYGFYQAYTTKEQGRTGYRLEKWHWSYLPLANPYLDYYNANITYKDIRGFIGAEYAEKNNIIIEYVNGISKKSKAYNYKK